MAVQLTEYIVIKIKTKNCGTYNYNTNIIRYCSLVVGQSRSPVTSKFNCTPIDGV